MQSLPYFGVDVGCGSRDKAVRQAMNYRGNWLLVCVFLSCVSSAGYHWQNGSCLRRGHSVGLMAMARRILCADDPGVLYRSTKDSFLE